MANPSCVNEGQALSVPVSSDTFDVSKGDYSNSTGAALKLTRPASGVAVFLSAPGSHARRKQIGDVHLFPDNSDGK